MAYISYIKVWESEFDKIVSKKRLQNMNNNQIKLEVNDSFKKDEKITTKFEASNPGDVIKKAYLDEKLSKIEGEIADIEKDYNEFILNNKEDLLIQRAVRTTIQIFYDKGLFDNYDNTDQVIKASLFFEINDRLRPNLEQNKRCRSTILFININ